MKKIILVFTLLLTTLSVSGCSKKNRRVLVDCYPLQYVVSKIAGDDIDVDLISSGYNIQLAHYNGNEKLLKDSDAMFYIDDLTPYFDIYENDFKSSGMQLVDLGYRGKYYKFERYQLNDFNHIQVSDNGPYYNDSIFTNINVYQNDPMVWMDVSGMIGISDTVEKELIELYPDKKEEIKSNYQQLKKDLALLDSNYQNLKKDSVGFKLASIFPNYGNWQKYLGMQIYPISISKYGVMPNCKQLNYIEQQLIDNNVRYIVKPQMMTKDVEKVYNEVVEKCNLIPVEISNTALLSKEQKAENKDYLTIMYDNLNVLERLVWNANNSN